MVSASLLGLLADNTTVPPIGDNHEVLVALISSMAAVLVAVIGGMFASFGGARRRATEPSAARSNCAAWEIWLLLHGFDPRAIRTGFEPEDEVMVRDDP